MKFSFFPFLAVLLGPHVLADLQVNTQMSHQTFLRYESIPVRVNVRNRTGDTLQFGGVEANAFLRVVVTDTQMRIVHRTETPVFPRMWLAPDGLTSTLELELTELFDLRESGSYRCEIAVVFDREQWNTPVQQFEIRNGTRQGRLRVRNTDRTFTLLTLNRGRRQDLMMRVSDYREDQIIGTYELERVLLFLPPEMRMDDNGVIHVLFYKFNDLMVYCRFQPDGTPIIREYLRPVRSRPRLVEHPDMGFWVPAAEILPPVGGVDRATPTPAPSAD